MTPLARPATNAGVKLRLFAADIKIAHTVFALPFALSSAAIAWRERPFDPLDLLGILLCMVLARSAAMAFNRIVDRTYDAANPRTAQRHLPAGRLTLKRRRDKGRKRLTV